ncbi:general transcription factor II-I repeat domain-containing protein 2-like [Centruroides sculpturatus]|uniref:general transcription factor II-I repeat domain-containing protein 2-like n=1 Tax=Centruroides sculpturatus TaxID=218467 RepID=UPI000C6D140A|nr:general transcription factor II-I repeat domain-containing protein 2-like [Centruroides sculpturatus]
MVFNDCKVKEDILSVLPLQGNTRGKDIYKVIKNYIKEINLPLQNLVSITTDGAPAMIGSGVVFITLCKNDAEFSNFVHYHCIIHQQALCTKVLHYEHVMKVVKIVNSIRARPLQSRLFKILTDELDAEYGTLMLHSEVRWLSKGKVLQRFVDLLPEIKLFVESRDETYEELNGHVWLSDLSFLTDITAKINKLNLELEGEQRTLFQLIGSVNAFQSKLNLWISQIKGCNFSHFPNLQNYIHKYKKIESDKYSENLAELKNNFEIRFSDFPGNYGGIDWRGKAAGRKARYRCVWRKNDSSKGRG